jgi:hypothetical protein
MNAPITQLLFSRSRSEDYPGAHYEAIEIHFLHFLIFVVPDKLGKRKGTRWKSNKLAMVARAMSQRMNEMDGSVAVS